MVFSGIPISWPDGILSKDWLLSHAHYTFVYCVASLALMPQADTKRKRLLA
jgi:hypothetical protein